MYKIIAQKLSGTNTKCSENRIAAYVIMRQAPQRSKDKLILRKLQTSYKKIRFFNNNNNNDKKSQHIYRTIIFSMNLA